MAKRRYFGSTQGSSTRPADIPMQFFMRFATLTTRSQHADASCARHGLQLAEYFHIRVIQHTDTDVT